MGKFLPFVYNYRGTLVSHTPRILSKMGDKDLIPMEQAIDNLPSVELSLPVSKKSGKKGKIFADKSTMLRLIEEIGDKETDRINFKISRDVEKLKVVALREAVASRKKENKQERLRRIKETLRQKRASESAPERKTDSDEKSGGKPNKFGRQDRKGKSASFKGRRVEKSSMGQKKRVSFKE